MSSVASGAVTHLLGVDIGGTKCAVVLGSREADRVRILRRVVTPTTRGDPLEMLRRLEDVACEELEAAGLAPADVERVGISCGGPLSEDEGLVLGPPNLPGWGRVPVVEHFRSALGIDVRLANDANAGALAEWWWGTGRGTTTMVFLTFGTGLGAGLIIDGRLHRGAHGLAGEVGHVRVAPDGPLAYGKSGSWEGYSSGNGLRRLAIECVRREWSAGRAVAFCDDESRLEALDVVILANAARAGDALARSIFATSGRHLGKGIAALADIIDPEVVVVGGIYGRCLDLLESDTLAAFEEEMRGAASRSCRISPAGLGEAIGDYSALAVALAATDSTHSQTDRRAVEPRPAPEAG